MSDFSSVTVSHQFPLLLWRGQDARYYQTTDFPEDPGHGCIGGTIEQDGLFVRTDSGLPRWNPELNGWAYFIGVGTRADFAARFVDGRVAEMRSSEDVFDTDIGSSLPPAYASPNKWLPAAVEMTMKTTASSDWQLVTENPDLPHIDGVAKFVKGELFGCSEDP